MLARDAAYRIVSTGPVVGAQLNPIETLGSLGSADCSDPHSFSRYCFAHTNDASLLRAAHALGNRYHVVSRAGLAHLDACAPEGPTMRDGPSGFFTIVGVREEPTEVTVRARVALLGGGSDPGVAAGEAITRTLGRGDVWQLVADSPRTPEECDAVGSICVRRCQGALDPTGTRIESTAPVAVFSGHDCARAPDDVAACEHLEEQLVPSDALGREYLVAPLPRFWERQGPSLVRVVSTAAGTTIELEPPVNAPVTLDEGEHLELELTEPVRIRSDAPVSVHQFQSGQGYSTRAAGDLQDLFALPHNPNTAGADPTMISVRPLESWAIEQVVHVSETFAASQLHVTAVEGSEVYLDGTPLELTWTAMGFGGASVRVPPGTHVLRSDNAFSARLVGVGQFTAYGQQAGTTANVRPPD